MTKSPTSPTEAVAYLRSTRTIRERCATLLRLAREGKSKYFAVNESAIPLVIGKVVALTRKNYPDLKIPYHSRWRHFEDPENRRMGRLETALRGLSLQDRGAALFDLAVVSVLLDAGAGMSWRYQDAFGSTSTRSEGLALASFDAFIAGAFSCDSKFPLRADGEKLKSISAKDIETIFQVSEVNPLVGVEGRASLLRRLGEVVSTTPHFFGDKLPRIGGLFNYLNSRSVRGTLSAREVLSSVLSALGPIWPGRIDLDGVNLGDVWKHSAIKSNDLTDGLVPFHKLSQWLTYSLLEPLQQSGIKITEMQELTGLAEYRNGGLLLDGGVLVPIDASILKRDHEAGSEFVVEWRALTVALIDEIAVGVREMLNLSQEAMPLASVLQGGTWGAGRELAQERRADGGPPFRISSDGTVF